MSRKSENSFTWLSISFSRRWYLWIADILSRPSVMFSRTITMPCMSKLSGSSEGLYIPPTWSMPVPWVTERLGLDAGEFAPLLSPSVFSLLTSSDPLRMSSEPRLEKRRFFVSTCSGTML